MRFLGACFVFFLAVTLTEHSHRAGRAHAGEESQATDLQSGIVEAVSAAPQFIEILTSNGLAALGQRDQDRSLRETALRKTFHTSFATTDIARLAVGVHWRRASETEKALFIDALGGHLANLLITNFPIGHFEVFDAQEIAAPESGPRRVDVNTVFVADGFTMRVLWTVGMYDSGFKVLDVSVAGRSYVLTRKAEFETMLQRNGGSLSGLTTEMRR